MAEDHARILRQEQELMPAAAYGDGSRLGSHAVLFSARVAVAAQAVEAGMAPHLDGAALVQHRRATHSGHLAGGGLHTHI